MLLVIYLKIISFKAVRGGSVGYDAAPQSRMSRVLFPIVSLDFFDNPSGLVQDT
jgi:hypothetical protein